MITIEKVELLGPLAKVTGVTDKRNTLPVLSSVMVEVAGGEMRLTGTDMEVTLIAQVSCEGGPWRGCLPAQKFLATVKAMPSEHIKLTPGENDVLIISSGRSRLKLPTMPADAFPKPDLPESNAVSLPADDLGITLAAVRPTMAKNDVRHYLNGTLLHASDGKLLAVATDGHRLGYAEMAFSAEFRLILPHRGVEALLGLLTGETVSIAADSRVFLAESGCFTLIAKQINGRFPDWERVVPEPKGRVTVSAGLFRGALERAAIAAFKEGVKIGISRTEMTFAAMSQSGEELDDVIGAESDMEMVIGASIGYLVDAIKVAGTEEIEIGLQGSDKAIVVRPVGRSDRYTVVMPMRL